MQWHTQDLIFADEGDSGTVHRIAEEGKLYLIPLTSYFLIYFFTNSLSNFSNNFKNN